MIRHIVLWAFNDPVTESERSALLDAIRALPEKVPHVRSVAVGANLSPARAQGYSFAYLATFDKMDDLRAYAAHPDHLPVAARLRELAATLIAVDLED